jgi:hypothetical protein
MLRRNRSHRRALRIARMLSELDGSRRAPRRLARAGARVSLARD